MGLSSKQVSCDGHGWSQTLLQANTLPASMTRPPLQQQQTEQLNCPRCDSKNTKFCYYNNHNKSQPRHFCKTCKRHWTKGGTLRNVTVGGGRKNKRLKTTNTAVAVQSQQQRQNLNPFANQALIHQPTPSNMGSFISQSLNIIPYASTTTSFNTTPSSISTSFQLSNVFDSYAGESLEEATNIINSTASMPMTQPWQIASTSSGMDNNMPSYWNWDDIDTIVSTDLNIPWGDSDIKP